MSRVVTIHQPDFMPWLGLFDKINNADTFIVLDHVTNNPKSPEFWCRRVKMLIGGKDHWMSISLKKDERETFIPINKMEINMDESSVRKFKNSVELNYRNAPFFSEVYYLIEDYFEAPLSNLCEKNTNFIKEVMRRLEIGTELLFSSNMQPQFSSNEMLIDLLKKASASVYLCGSGASGYQKDELYIQEGIQVKYNNFVPTVYPQFNKQGFVKGLSIIDVLMNIGFKGCKGLLIRK